jgi:hypothetical protein
MNKSKVISTGIVAFNIMSSFLFLNLEHAFIVSIASLAISLRFWFGYKELGIYRLVLERNFWSNSQGMIIGWIVLALIFLANVAMIGININNKLKII